MNCKATARPRAGGFTLIELVVVIVLAGILAMAVAPRFANLDAFDGPGYRDQLRSILRYAQKTAMAQRRQTLVQYSANAVVFCSEPFLAVPVCPATVSCAAGGRTALALPGGAFRAGPAAITANGVVCFNARGQAYGGAGILNLGGGQSISIVAATGYVQ